MEKHDLMMAIRKNDNKNKEQQAMHAIDSMLRHGEEVSVAALVRETGLSRSYFYTNQKVRAKMDEAKAKQEKDRAHGKGNTIRKTFTEKENQKLKKENEQLKKKIAKLKEKLKRYEDQEEKEDLKYEESLR